MVDTTGWTDQVAAIPNPPAGCTPWAWAALTDVAREATLALYADHRLRLHMAAKSPRGPFTAWVVDEAARPWTVHEGNWGADAEDVAYRAIRGALAAWRTAP